MSFPDVNPVVIASHPRSGTHLLIDLLRRQFKPCRSWKWWGERLDRLYCSIDELGASRGRLNEATAHRILRRTERPLIKTHAWPSFEEVFLQEHHDGLPESWTPWLQSRSTQLYTVRDPRDVMASYQMFRQWFDENATGSLGAFLRGSDNAGSPNRIANWVRHVRAWQATEGVHVFRFEDVLHDTKTQVQRLAEVLELDPEWQEPLLPKRFANIWESRWARLFQTQPESTAIIGTGSQNWEGQLTQEDHAFVHEHAGDLLVELGYVEAEEWTDGV